jgi:hypothetical protein
VRNNCARAALFLLTAVFTPHSARAQITNVTNSTSTPTPGVGHDYIKLLEGWPGLICLRAPRTRS